MSAPKIIKDFPGKAVEEYRVTHGGTLPGEEKLWLENLITAIKASGWPKITEVELNDLHRLALKGHEAEELERSRYVNGEQRRRSDCAWTQDSDGLYNTGCGHVWFFDSGTAAENEAKFCVYCGGNLKANEYVEEPDDSSPPISRGSERG